MSEDVDEIDRSILRELQEDARHNTNTEIGDRVGVSTSTVGKRATALEERGIIEGYVPIVDYGAIGLPIRILLVGTAPLDERSALVSEIQSIDGVVSIRELMTGDGNLHVQAIGATDDDIAAVARAIEDLGVDVNEELLLRSERLQPSRHAEPTESPE